jgi:hypothetical protein
MMSRLSLEKSRYGEREYASTRSKLRKWGGLVLFGAVTLALCSCGGGDSPVLDQNAQVAGNWQFTLTTSGDSFVASPLQGGFLQQNNGALSGQIAFSIVLPGSPQPCNTGTATVTGTISGQTVNLTAVMTTLDQSGNSTAQSLTLSGGALSSDGATIQNGTYGLTAGYYNNTSSSQVAPCGLAQDAGTWSATLVPPVTGGFQGFFHSTGTGFNGGGLGNQDFAVSGTLTQGPNIGTSSATVTGTLIFQDPVSLLNDYPCLTTASLNGTISGNTVLLQIFATNGADVGQIGQTPGSSSVPNNPVRVVQTQGGFVLRGGSGTGEPGYAVTTKPCPTTDSGDICLAFQGTNACKQPITLVPFFLAFEPQLLGSAATTQTITLSNVSGSSLTGVTLTFAEDDNTAAGFSFYPSGGDFNGVHHFTEQDTCGSQQGAFNLDAGGSCTITVLFSPQESCPWLPQTQSTSTGSLPAIVGLPPAQCPITLSASLNVTIPGGSADKDNQFLVPITGTAISFVAPSVPEIDFGAEALGEASPPQTVTFTNQSPNRVTILPAPSAPCTYSNRNLGLPLERPPQAGSVGGLAVAETADLPNPTAISANSSLSPPTALYNCDSDPPPPKGSGNPNILLSNDGCLGVTLQPFGQSGDSCSLQLTFVPQPGTWGKLTAASNSGLDDFLELNTAWCGDAKNPPQPNCEIDSGRFPVEIKTNLPSPLRMTPGAGMDFGIITEGITSSPLSITLFNDPADPNAGTVNITNKVVSGSDYLETDDCPPSLPTNSSCTITVTFTPKVVGLDPGSIAITYSLASQLPALQTIYMRGSGCTVLPSGACVTENPELRRRH